ncbi:MAG: hypothetical protein JWQ87_5401 [Candidatus Sulfotelmatobacter sp.]|nr:hypothetical protein [Candidatus Sulfotelmatobacter sp.]
MICEYCHQAEAVIVEGCPYRVCDQCWAYLGIARVKRLTTFGKVLETLRLARLFCQIVWREDQTGLRMSAQTAFSVCSGLREGDI